MISSDTAIKPAALLQQALPADWTPEEKQIFYNWHKEVTRLHDTLATIAAERPRLLWRAAKIHHKLRGALVRAAQAAEQGNAKNAADAGGPTAKRQ